MVLSLSRSPEKSLRITELCRGITISCDMTVRDVTFNSYHTIKQSTSKNPRGCITPQNKNDIKSEMISFIL